MAECFGPMASLSVIMVSRVVAFPGDQQDTVFLDETLRSLLGLGNSMLRISSLNMMQGLHDAGLYCSG